MNSVSYRLHRFFIVPHLRNTRGWPYVLAWGHRVSGVVLALYLVFHVYTLLLLEKPELFDAQMAIYRSFPFNVLAWFLAFPVIFHALNGGRIILYESYGLRKDRLLIGVVIALSIITVTGLGILMMIAVQITVRELYWGPILLVSVLLCFLVSFQLAKSGAGFTWKLQRLTASFLLLMIPAHMLFMHAHPSMAHSAGMVINRMQIQMIKVIDALMALCVLYHGGYGFSSIANDYIARNHLRSVLVVAIWLLVVLIAYFAIRFVISI